MGNSNTKKNEKEQARPSNASGNKANLINKNPEEDSQFEVM
jgi:hypothetical protein